MVEHTYCHRMAFVNLSTNELTGTVSNIFGKALVDQQSRFARGEGAIVIVVKSLQNALDDKDHIYCTVSFL
jgi:hypothetical protein